MQCSKHAILGPIVIMIGWSIWPLNEHENLLWWYIIFYQLNTYIWLLCGLVRVLEHSKWLCARKATFQLPCGTTMQSTLSYVCILPPLQLHMEVFGQQHVWRYRPKLCWWRWTLFRITTTSTHGICTWFSLEKKNWQLARSWGKLKLEEEDVDHLSTSKSVNYTKHDL